MDTTIDSSDSNYHFPENLTQDQLVQILTKRRILCNNTEHCPLRKGNLIDLFKRFVVPLPQRALIKGTENERKPREMLSYIKLIPTEDRRKPESTNDTHPNDNNKKQNDEVRRPDDMNKPLTSIVRISTKNSEKNRKPVKLKRKHPRLKDEEVMSKKPNEKITSES